MADEEQFKLMHVKFDLRRIMVLSWYDHDMTKFRLAIKLQNWQKGGGGAKGVFTLVYVLF